MNKKDAGMTELAQKLANARARAGRSDFVGCITMHCDLSDCNAREVTVKIKEYSGDTPDRLNCPACHRELKFSQVSSLREYERQKYYEARCLVNVQSYVKQQRQANGGSGMISVPAALFDDDRISELDSP